jgi:hypothetical protein
VVGPRILVDVHERQSGIAGVLTNELREEWREVRGIGPDRARALEEALTGVTVKRARQR